MKIIIYAMLLSVLSLPAVAGVVCTAIGNQLFCSGSAAPPPQPYAYPAPTWPTFGGNYVPPPPPRPSVICTTIGNQTFCN